MKRNHWVILGTGFVVVIIMFVITLVRDCERKVPTKSTSITEMKLLRDSARRADQINKLNDSIGKLNFLLDDCRGNKKPAPVIAKKPTAKVVRTATPPPPPATQPKVDYTKEPAAVVAVTKAPSKPTAKIAQDKYFPDYSGEYGVTINEYMEIVYYISDKLLISGESKPTLPAPLLYENSPQSEFQYNKNTGYWTYSSGEIVQESVLINGYTKIWNVYIGRNAEWDFPMFIPHELAKIGLKSIKEDIKLGRVKQHKNDIGYDYYSLVTFLTR